MICSLDPGAGKPMKRLRSLGSTAWTIVTNIIKSPLIIVGLVTVALYYVVILAKHAFSLIADRIKLH
jgi:hypothetical protein